MNVVFKHRRKNRSGVSMLFVLVSLIVTGILGSSLLKMSTSDQMSNIYYKGSASAQSAAKSGMIAGVSVLENGKVENLTMLKSWIANSTNEPIEIASGSISSDGSMSYSTKLLAFDSENFNVTLQSKGIGKDGSRSTLTAVYHLSGLGYEESELSTWGEENALFLGDGLSLNTHDAFDIDGDVYIGNGGNIHFDTDISGSIFRGNFVVAKADSENDSTFRVDAGTVQFMGPAYIGRRPHFTGSVNLVFSDKVGFEWGVEMKANDTIELQNNSYWNYSNYGWYWESGRINQNSNKLYHNGKYNYVYDNITTVNGPTPKVVNAAQMTLNSDIKISDSLGIKVSQCEIQVHPDVIDESYITDWNDGESTDFTGTLANDMYRDAPKWNDFMVLRLQSSLSLVDDGVTFKEKLIVLVNGKRIFTSSGGVMTCEPDANFSIIGNGGNVDNIGGWDHYRGLMWAGPDCEFLVGGSPPSAENMHGAIYAVPGVERMEWYPPGNSVSFITFDSTVLEELDHDGFLTKENCDLSSEPKGKTIITLIQTQPNLATSLISQFI